MRHGRGGDERIARPQGHTPGWLRGQPAAQLHREPCREDGRRLPHRPLPLAHGEGLLADRVLGQVHALGGAVRAHDGRRAAAREHRGVRRQPAAVAAARRLSRQLPRGRSLRQRLGRVGMQVHDARAPVPLRPDRLEGVSRRGGAPLRLPARRVRPGQARHCQERAVQGHAVVQRSGARGVAIQAHEAPGTPRVREVHSLADGRASRRAAPHPRRGGSGGGAHARREEGVRGAESGPQGVRDDELLPGAAGVLRGYRRQPLPRCGRQDSGIYRRHRSERLRRIGLRGALVFRARAPEPSVHAPAGDVRADNVDAPVREAAGDHGREPLGGRAGEDLLQRLSRRAASGRLEVRHLFAAVRVPLVRAVPLQDAHQLLQRERSARIRVLPRELSPRARGRGVHELLLLRQDGHLAAVRREGDVRDLHALSRARRRGDMEPHGEAD